MSALRGGWASSGDITNIIGARAGPPWYARRHRKPDQSIKNGH
jgi:hypothetical protein